MGYVQKRGRVAGQYSDEQMNRITAVKTLSKIFKDEGWRIFALAILASLIWHLFWFSTIAIVSNPINARSVKFSKVSFLGPLLEGGSIGLRAKPKERSFLETRYIDETHRLLQRPGQAITATAYKYENGNDAYHLRDEKMIMFIDDALSGENPEPSYEE